MSSPLTLSKVCSRHFSSDKMIEPTTLQGRRRLTKGAVATLFEWNQYTVETPRRGVWERVDRFVETAPPEDEVDLLFNDQDYCSLWTDCHGYVRIRCWKRLKWSTGAEKRATGVTSPARVWTAAVCWLRRRHPNLHKGSHFFTVTFFVLVYY